MVSSLTSDTNVSWSIDSENNKDDVVGDVASTPRAVLFGGEVARPSEGSAILSSEHQSSRYHHRASELARPSSREESVVRPVAADGGIKETSGGILAGGALRGANEKKRQTEWKERDRNETESASDIVEWKKNGGRSNSITSKPSSSMSLELQNHQVNTSSPQDSGHYSNGPERAAGGDVGVEEVAVPSSCTVKVTGGNDEEESYEAFGSVEGDHDDGLDSPGGGSSSAPSPTGPNSNRNPRSPNSTIGRHSWLRTSLRRTPPCSGRKRLSTSALASQLYRSGSFNSSGRGSNCDTADDMTMYSDVSLEEDVMDLNHKVQILQDQMHALADTQSVGEERYARVKQENATLQARILMLEEAAKDAESRAEERLQAEQRRHREWANRMERERQLQLENYAIKLQAMELETSNFRNEIARLREQLEKTKAIKDRLESEVEDAKRDVGIARENERQAVSRTNEAHQLLRAAKAEALLRAEDQQRLEELEQQVVHLQAHNMNLEEQRDELQAAAALQAGRELLMLNPCGNNTEKGPSLAVELMAGINQEQVDGQATEDYEPPCSISELKQALKEQQEVNAQLRAYIDGILLNIVDNYPQLLEVKQGH